MDSVELQKLINLTVPPMRKQGFLSRDENDNCLYRDGKGNKCQIGHAIKDEYYSSSLEFLSVKQGGEVYLALVQSNPDVNFYEISEDALLELQEIHDMTQVDFSDYEDNVLSFCDTYNLEVPPIRDK